jgi:hypothetical protein
MANYCRAVIKSLRGTRVKKSIKYNLKIISMIIHLNFNDYLLKYSH